MVLTDIQAVRLKTSDKSNITREQVTADGESQHFKLERQPVVTSTLQLWVDDVLTTVGFTVNEIDGVVSFATAPSVNQQLEFQYYWSIYTDEEVQHFLDESSGNITVASARLLLALSADAAKLAQRETLQGGGGIGAVTRDTAVTSKELRETAKAFIEHAILVYSLEGVEPADGLTEIPWTTFNLESLLEQDWLRELDI